MGVKAHRDKWQVDLRGTYVGTYPDESTAAMVEQSGKLQLTLGKPLPQVISELRGRTEKTVTLEAYWTEWIASHNAKPQSIARYKYAWGRIPESLRQAPIADVGPRELRNLVKTLSDSYAPNTVHQTLTVLKALLIEAHYSGLCELPPKRLKNMPVLVAERKPYALTREQHKAIVAVVPEFYRDMVALWPLVGLRRGETVALEWDDYDGTRLWVRRQLTNERVVTPTKYADRHQTEERYVDLTTEARRILDERERFGRLIFPGKDGKYMGFSYLNVVLLKAGEPLGLELRTHIFRHTFISWGLRAGLPVTYLAARAGHTPQELMKTYAHEIADIDGDNTLIGRLESWMGTP